MIEMRLRLMCFAYFSVITDSYTQFDNYQASFNGQKPADNAISYYEIGGHSVLKSQ